MSPRRTSRARRRTQKAILAFGDARETWVVPEPASGSLVVNRLKQLQLQKSELVEELKGLVEGVFEASVEEEQESSA